MLRLSKIPSVLRYDLMTGIMTIIGLLSAPATHKRDVKMGTTAKQTWMGAQLWLSPAKVQKCSRSLHRLEARSNAL